MSRLRLDDDLFSPVRLDATIGETSDSSEGDQSNAEEFSLRNSVKNKVTFGKSVVKLAKENELKSKESKFVNTYTPILTQNSSDKLHAKKHFSELKLEKIKDSKSATVRKENSESQKKRQELLYTENILDPSTPKIDVFDKLHHKKSRPTSLLLKNGSMKQDSLKDIRKKQKVSDHILKGSSVDGVEKSNLKLLAKKKLTSSSSSSVENSDIKHGNLSTISIESKENASINSLEKEKCSSVTQEIEKLSVSALHTSYEEGEEEASRPASDTADLEDLEESEDKSEDENDFIVDDDGQPITKGKKKQKIYNDAALLKAQEIFGVDFDYAEEDEYDEEMEEDYEEDVERPSRQKKSEKRVIKQSLLNIFEPVELERNHLADQDEIFQATIKKMIRNSISSEWTKIRQLMYMQQMSFIRETNKIKDEVKKQHLATTECLYKVIEELMRMNASLRAVSNKN